jgi:hypothetical protein
MAELGLSVTDADERAFADYIAKNKEEKHGSHSYTAEEYGLSAEQLQNDFRFYTEEYL